MPKSTKPPKRPTPIYSRKGLPVDVPKSIPRPKKIDIPDSMMKASMRSLKSGNYQRKIAAFFAPHILVSAFQDLAAVFRDGCASAKDREQALQVYDVLKKGVGSVSVFVNQNNANLNASRAIPETADGIGSFEDAIRMVAEKRRLRLQNGSVPVIAEPVFIPTPED